jgi:dienelactone hydrolase
MPLTRRDTFKLALGGALAGRVKAQSPAPPEAPGRRYSACLPDYLRTRAADAYARRKARISALNSPAAIREYQAWARETFIRLAGGLPERTPLNTRTVGAFDRARYRVEKLVYESRPGLVVTANLYIPKDATPPFPGVLFQMGHSNNGKGMDSYQRCCQGLAQLGYLVLAFDPYGQGERTNYPQPGGWLTRLSSPTEEHSLVGRQMLLVGQTASALMVWDAIRSLDVLAAHPSVDPGRLATTGQSGGGTLSMLLTAADGRLAASAIASGNTENLAANPYLPPGSADDAEQDMIASGPAAFDRWDLLWPMAPKPLLVAISGHDFFGTYSPSYETSGREEFANLARAYSAMGARDSLQWYETPLPHSLSYSFRLAIYSFFERFLKPNGRTVSDEPPTEPEPDQTLWCGATGNVVRDFHSRTPFQFTRERAAATVTPVQPPDLRALLGLEKPAAPPRLAVRAEVPYPDCRVQAVEVNTAEKVWSPAWLFLPTQAWTRLLLVTEPNGRNAHWREGDLYSQLAAAGVAVCAADVRGIGDLEPEYGPGSAGYIRGRQGEEGYSWASLILGHCLLGQRTADIAGVAQALAAAYPNARISLAARQKMTVPALCAAALEPRIATLYLAQHLVSWRSVLEQENYTAPLANFAWDIVRHTDLPQLAASLAPREAIVAGALDAAGQLAPNASALYPNARPAAAWDFATLSQL